MKALCQVFQVMDGAYDGAKLSSTDQAVLTDNGRDKNGYDVPLEIMPSGQFEPLYKTTLSVQVYTTKKMWLNTLTIFH